MLTLGWSALTLSEVVTPVALLAAAGVVFASTVATQTTRVRMIDEAMGGQHEDLDHQSRRDRWLFRRPLAEVGLDLTPPVRPTARPQLIPWFLATCLILAVLASFGVIPSWLLTLSAEASRLCLLMAIAARE